MAVVSVALLLVPAALGGVVAFAVWGWYGMGAVLVVATVLLVWLRWKDEQ